jgi:MFS family permease
MARSPASQLLRGFGLVVYGPTTMYSMVKGALIPLIPVLAHHFSNSVAIAGIAVAMLSVGELLGSLPAGGVIARLGERRTMLISSAIGVVGIVGVALAPSLLLLMLGALLVGIGSSAFGLARHALLTTYAPAAIRARAMSLMGGSGRLGQSIGPLIAGALLSLTASNEVVIGFSAVMLLATALLVWFSPELTPETMHNAFRDWAPPSAHTTEQSTAHTQQPEDAQATDGDGFATQVSDGSGETASQEASEQVRVSFWLAIREGLPVLARLGLGMLALSLLRSGREAIIPLWGISLNANAETISWIAGFSGVLDFLLFYASGQIMDRYGRLAAAVPSALGMSAAFVGLWVSHLLPGPIIWWIACSLFMGLANGVSAGIIKTMGSDVAPKSHPAPFLGAWNTLADVGTVGAPLLISAVTSVASLPFSALLLALSGFAGVVALWRWVPEYIPHRRANAHRQ